MPSSAERVEFNAQMAVLCAGFNVPPTAERLEAYWVGLSKMQMPAVVRVVDYALGQDGPEKIPNAPALWMIYRKLKSTARPAPSAGDMQGPVVDAYTAFANRALMVFLQQRGAADPAVLPRLVDEKNRIAGDFRIIAAEEEVTPEEFRERLFAAFARVHREIPPHQIEADRERICRERGLLFTPSKPRLGRAA